MGLVEDLVWTTGADALLAVRPYVPEGEETFRWEVEIDGADIPDVDVRVRDHPERPDLVVMSLVRGEQEVEIETWLRRRDPSAPAAVLRTLSQLPR